MNKSQADENASAPHSQFSQHRDRKGVSDSLGKQSNLCYLFEKVTQIFSCLFKSNVTLLST